MKPIYATWMLSNNIGDALTPWLIEKVTGQTPIYVPFDVPYPKFMVSGSVLNHASDYTTVWGAGFANFEDCLNAKAVIKAVRGPVTKARVEFQAGIPVPCVGDPALFMPRFYDPRTKPDKGKPYKVGFIPHYVHQQETAAWLNDRDDIKLINVFDTPERFVLNLLQCETVFSSSLHGLVIADAYGVPRAWYNGTARLGGDGAKFADYFMLVQGKEKAPPAHPHIEELPKDVTELYKLAMQNPPPDVKATCDALWEACPFKRPVQQEHKLDKPLPPVVPGQPLAAEDDIEEIKPR